MGYSIYIGQAEVVFDADYPEEALYIRVNRIENDNAPRFENDDMTGRSNNRHPSYSGWADFVRRAGLSDLFSNKETGIMREHPGCFLLTENHYQQIKSALEAWNVKHHDTVAGFSSSGLKPFFVTPTTSFVMMSDGGEDEERDHTKARLMWLEWWVRWALDNCSIPAIYNS